MASIDVCISKIEEKGAEYFEDYVQLLKETRKELQKLKKLNLQQTREYDLSKIVISARDTEYTGKDIYNILLKKYHLQMEMAEMCIRDRDHLLSKEEEVCTEHLASRKARLVRRHIAEHSKAMKEQLSIVEGSRRGKRGEQA